jgi:hypothetical protein
VHPAGGEHLQEQESRQEEKENQDHFERLNKNFSALLPN